MNDQLTNKLLEYLQNVEQFASKQIPDFVDQFIKYETWKCEWTFKISLIVMIFFFVLAFVAFIASIIKEYDASIASFVMVATGIVFFISMGFTISNYMDLRQMEIAPKVYILKQAKNFVMESRK